MSVPLKTRVASAWEKSDGSVGDSVNRQKQQAPTSRQIRYQLNRALALLEYCSIYIMGAIFGISHVVRYLRNPNPLISVRLLRAFGAAIGNRTTIKRSLMLDNVYRDRNSTGDFSHLKIGDNCYIGDCVFFDLANDIVIESNAVISGYASFNTHAECRRSGYLSQKFPRKCERILVGSGAWIGFGATVMAGVTIGANSVVGAMSLLLQDAETHSIYVGSPARKLRQIE